MANDRDDQNKSDAGKNAGQANQSGQKREIGEGMHSLDSTQAPLKADTGEVDWDAKNGTAKTRDDDTDAKDRNR